MNVHNETPLTNWEWGFIAVFCLFVVAIFLSLFIMSVTSKDLVMFERQKTVSRKHYRNIKTTLRINGLAVAVMCVFMLVAAPFVAMEEGGIFAAVLMVNFFGIVLWLSVRWFLWSIGRLQAPTDKLPKRSSTNMATGKTYTE